MLDEKGFKLGFGQIMVEGFPLTNNAPYDKSYPRDHR